MTSDFDLGVEGGLLVTSRGRRRANIYVRDGTIAAITNERQPAREVVSAVDLLVMPGMVDAHVHLMDPGAPEREDFPTGTAAAARAGVTSIVEHSHITPVRTDDRLKEKIDYVGKRARIDYALAAHAWPGDVEAAVEVWRAGAAFVKAFTCRTHGIPAHDAAELHRLFAGLEEVDGVCLVHCEDESLTAEAERVLHLAGRSDGAIVFEWRNRDAELLATSTTALMAQRTGARVVIAHASNPEIAAIAHQHRSAGARLWVETCPQYFMLFEHEAIDWGALRKFTPPARARTDADLAQMWRCLAEGQFDIVSSDHAPSTIEQKQESIWEAHFGLPGLDTTICVLLDAAHRGLISYERVAEVYSERPGEALRFVPQQRPTRAGIGRRPGPGGSPGPLDRRRRGHHLQGGLVSVFGSRDARSRGRHVLERQPGGLGRAGGRRAGRRQVPAGCRSLAAPWQVMERAGKPIGELEKLNGVVLIMEGDSVTFQHAAGMAERSSVMRCTQDTRFQLASVSKQFTAAAILMLVERGVLSVAIRSIAGSRAVHQPGER